MARDGSGTHSLPQAAFVSGTTIESAKVNSNFSDVSAALTASIAKDGQTVPTANLPMGGFKHTGVADGSSRTDYAALGQVAKGTLFYAADTGAADVYVVAPSPGITANVVGFSVDWKVTNANLTTTPTLAANGLTAGTIKWPDGSALAAGDLPAGAMVRTTIVSLSGVTPTWHLMTVANPPLETARASAGIVRVQTFTSSGTYTPHAGMVNCIIECLGGGGGGGGTANPNISISTGGGGGGAGSYSTLLATAATIGASKAVTIGAAGTAGSAGNNAGGAGGDTSVDTLCVGKGGSGGAGNAGGAGAAAAGGAGGVAGTGTVTGAGQGGMGAGAFTSSFGYGGGGGASRWGSGGRAVTSATAATGDAATGYGGGGGGGQSYNGAGATAGGVGTAGIVIITEYCNQ